MTSHLQPPDHNLENLLSAVTEAMLGEESDFDQIVARYGVDKTDVRSYIRIIRRLHVALVGVRPSQRFVSALRMDLMGEANHRMLSRLRHLPPRVQVAAGIALVAGFMLLSRRRFTGGGSPESREVPVI